MISVNGHNRRGFARAVLLCLFTAAGYSLGQDVTIYFSDSVMVSDTLIRIEDLGRVECSDSQLAAEVGRTSAGESAPPGYSRFVNTNDLLLFRLKPLFKSVTFNAAEQKRIKVRSDYVERTVGEFEKQIATYVAKNLGWKEGEWNLTVNNPESSWKSFRGDVQVQLKGLNNPFVKGNFNLLLEVRQGASTNRIPVSCHMQVMAPVLVAVRQIGRGEQLDSQNCVLKTMDITHFAHVPLREIPQAGESEVIRTISQGDIVHEKVLRAVPVVARGDQVQILFSSSRIKVSVLGRARESGGRGERVWVENLQTGKLIRAEVLKKGLVLVYQEGDNT